MTNSNSKLTRHFNQLSEAERGKIQALLDAGIPIYLHKPHPRKTLLAYQVKEIAEALKEAKLL